MNYKPPSKLENVCEKAKTCIEKGQYRFTAHGFCRKYERQITEQDALYVISNGWRVKARDEYCLINNGWKYVFEGKTLQDEQLRVVVAFVDNTMLIVTVMFIYKKS